MADRELLEAAARAAGLKVEGLADKMLVYPERWAGGLIITTPTGGSAAWNPLTDDGDALRLFCALPWLQIETSDLAATVLERGSPDEPRRVYMMWTEWLDKHNGNLASATRRAIVRAAAALAKDTA